MDTEKPAVINAVMSVFNVSFLFVRLINILNLGLGNG